MTKEFSSRLSAYMVRIDNISQRKLAREAGISSQAVCRLLKGNRNATSDISEKLADALRVPLEDRGEFLLFAAGHSCEQMSKALGRQPRLISEIKPVR